MLLCDFFLTVLCLFSSLPFAVGLQKPGTELWLCACSPEPPLCEILFKSLFSTAAGFQHHTYSQKPNPPIGKCGIFTNHMDMSRNLEIQQLLQIILPFL